MVVCLETILKQANEYTRPKLVVSIINYRTAELTLQCVKSVLADLSGIAARVVIVDNRSDDGSAEALGDWIAAQQPPVPVSLVLSPGNAGFSGGHNQGIAAQEAEYYLVLNSDTVLRPGFCKTLLEAADGLQALEVLRQQASPPDVVLVDLDMPGMDGIECITHIAHEHLAHAVVVVSALDPALHTLYFRSAGQ